MDAEVENIVNFTISSTKKYQDMLITKNIAGFDVVFSDNLIESDTRSNLSDLYLTDDESFKEIFNSNSNNNNNNNNNNDDNDVNDDGPIDKENQDLDKLNSNSQEENVIYSLPVKIFLSTLASTASLITICGNLLVMMSFFLDRQIRNPTNYFILSLSVSDFVIGLISIPFLTFYLMIGEWPFGEIICNIWLSLDYTVCLTSIYTVLFITIDRFCSVKMPAKYRKWRSPNKVISMVMLTWIVPISLFFPSIFGWSYLTRTKDFDSKICDVAWSSNKVFSVLLVFSYFWTTLIAIIVLYIFIYQVALNLEKKSREKQMKISSLVGRSATNTGAIVGALALPLNINLNKVSVGKTLNNSTSFNKNQEDTDSNSKLSKGSSNLKQSTSLSENNKKSPIANQNLPKTEDVNSKNSSRLSSFKAGLRKSIKGRLSLTNKDINNNLQAENLSTTNRKTSISYLKANHINPPSVLSKNKPSVSNTKIDHKVNPKVNKNLSYTSQTNSRDDEFSSSYDSHSDYELNNLKSIKINNKNNETILNNTQLKPRPESLAIMSYDLFAEKFQKQNNLSSNVNIKMSPTKTNSINSISQPENDNAQIKNSDNININNNNNNNNKNDSDLKPIKQIPFIDDEFDDLSYILHRRQFDKDNHLVPIKEETILIKSSFKTSTFFQKLTAPIKGFSSRRSSQRSNEIKFQQQSNPGTPSGNGVSFHNQVKSKLEVLGQNFISNRSLEVDHENNVENNPEKVGLLSDNKLINSSDVKFQPTITTTSNTTESTTTNNNNNKSPTINNTRMSPQPSPYTIGSTSLQTKLTSTNSKTTPNITPNTNKTNSLTRSNIFNNIANRLTSSHGDKNKNNGKRKFKHENRARKALRTITFILAAFIFCFAPWHVVSVYNSFCANCFESKLYHHFFYSCYFLCYMNSPINPFMYALANQQFKKTFIRILKGDWRRL